MKFCKLALDTTIKLVFGRDEMKQLLITIRKNWHFLSKKVKKFGMNAANISLHGPLD